jgi:hypothetical protein
MYRIVKKFLLISLIIVSITATAVPSSTYVSYTKPFSGQTAGNNFIYFNYTSGWQNCGSSVAIEGFSNTNSANISTGVISYSSNINFNGSTPKNITWVLNPFDSCVPNYSGGYPGSFPSLPVDSPAIQTTKTGVLAYHFTSSSGTVFTVSSQSPLSSYLPSQLTYTDSSGSKQMYFVGCSDDLYSGHTLLDCCYVANTQGDTSSCTSQQQ